MNVRPLLISGLISGLIFGLIPGLVAACLVVTPVMAQESRDGAATLTTSSGSAADDAASPNASVLLTRQSQRIEMLETDLREMRGQMETDLRSLTMQVTQLGNNASSDETATTAELRDLRDQVERLADAVSMASRRMERTLEITSDMEFRLLRMEKRMQTLMKLGGDELASAAVQDDTIPAGDTPEVSMKRDVTTGEITWQMSAGKLNEQLDASNQQQTTDLANVGAMPVDDGTATPGTAVTGATDLTTGDLETGDLQPGTAPSSVGTAAATSTPAPTAPVVAAPPKPEILPDASPEEQFQFAMRKAMQNDNENALLAFEEFIALNAGHERESDAVFWLGRLQFVTKNFDQAALTFSNFNVDFPNDSRLNETTMWLAEAVSNFLPPNEACNIYKQLPNFVKEPSDQLIRRVAELSEAANCGG